MEIGIIGAGNIGATLARKLAASGHEVQLAGSKGPDAIRDLARDAGAAAVSKEQAVEGVEAIVLSIPFARFPELSGLFADYPFRDGAIAEIDGGQPESLWVCEQIGRRQGMERCPGSDAGGARKTKGRIRAYRHSSRG